MSLQETNFCLIWSADCPPPSLLVFLSRGHLLLLFPQLPNAHPAVSWGREHIISIWLPSAQNFVHGANEKLTDLTDIAKALTNINESKGNGVLCNLLLDLPV